MIDGIIISMDDDEIKLPERVMDHLRVHDDDLVDFDYIAPGVVLLKKGNSL